MGVGETSFSRINQKIVCATNCPLDVISTDENSDSLKTIIHHIPCQIDYDGDAMIDEYFKVKKNSSVPTKKEQTDSIYVSLRGRELHGARIKVPNNTKGFILSDEELPEGCDPEVQSLWGVVDYFDGFTAWNTRTTPAMKKTYIETCFQWIDVAASIHDN